MTLPIPSPLASFQTPRPPLLSQKLLESPGQLQTIRHPVSSSHPLVRYEVPCEVVPQLKQGLGSPGPSWLQSSREGMQRHICGNHSTLLSPEQGIADGTPEDVEEEGGVAWVFSHPVHTSFTEQPDLSFGKATAAY